MDAELQAITRMCQTALFAVWKRLLRTLPRASRVLERNWISGFDQGDGLVVAEERAVSGKFELVHRVPGEVDG